MRKTVLSVALVLAMVPAAAQAQQETQTQTRTEAQARVQASLQTALQAGIPVALLERKVAEGRAKGVAMERIALAVENRLQALLRAQTAMQRAELRSTTEGELSVAADAVQAGVSEHALVEISRRAPQERRAVAVAVLADLVTLGHASDRALAQVQAALGRGPEALVNLQARTGAEVRARGGQGVGAGVSVGAGTGARVDLPAPARGRRNN